VGAERELQKKPVLARCQRLIVDEEVDRIVRVVVEDEQFVGLVLPVEIPHAVRDGIGQADGAGVAGRMMEAFHFCGRAVAKTVAYEEMLLRLFVGVVAVTDEERVAVEVVAEAPELSVACPQDSLACARQFVVVAILCLVQA